MSFSLEVKREIAQFHLEDDQNKAQLGAMILHCGTLSIQDKALRLKAKFNQTFIARRYVELMILCYGVKCELVELKTSNNAKKKQVEVIVFDRVKLILHDLGILTEKGLNSSISYTFLQYEENIRAYLSGWFLVAGSINSVKSSNYHCEIRVKQEEIAESLIAFFREFGIEFKMSQRRNEHFIYVKSAEKIGDLLRVVFAYNSLLSFEDARMLKDMRISMVRLDNCEIANEVKTFKASKEQLEAIDLLEKYHLLELQEKKIQEVALLRKQFPEHSLKELCEEYEILYKVSLSKSGLRHRLDKIITLANQVKEKRNG